MPTPSTEKVDPTRAKDLSERDEPMDSPSSKAMAEPILGTPITEIVDAIFATARIANELPTLALKSTDKDEPNRANLRRASEEPSAEKPRTERHEPTWE
jgi:hypothetical protein